MMLSDVDIRLGHVCQLSEALVWMERLEMTDRSVTAMTTEVYPSMSTMLNCPLPWHGRSNDNRGLSEHVHYMLNCPLPWHGRISIPAIGFC
ncbi:hypothetical protein PoB_000574200 [Plakobranchus ocellatus]|uniref:Uncharacterized protein n=1 Tax=Plakobranchus ocellatus TaxID=259542 RepID=A0AAV3YAV6_9GAST|nr:hypothetical protein PoB_000574200 [Plakobranchus ocellatus]